MSKFSSLSQIKSPVKIVALALASVTTLLTGCAMSNTASTGDTFAQAASITGHIHGGQQPITGATVRLYAAGTTGYGSASTLYATTSSASDQYGSFSFTKNAQLTGPTSGGSTPVYGCPTATDPQMYIIARGGNTGGGTNSLAGFIIALGKCSTISAATFVDLNEITTVATMAALQQYFGPANATASGINQLGYPNTTQATTGFANGVATIPNIANVAYGTIASPTLTATPAGSTTAAVVTVTPESAKINTIADILASCVNGSDSLPAPAPAIPANCTTLFNNANPPNPAVTSQPALNFGTATDTLQALYYMLTNPTSGSATSLTNLFALVSATAPFQPANATAPTDWTIGIRYSSTSACTVGTFLGSVYHVAPDLTGNIWIASGFTGNLMEISPTGVPLTCTLGTQVASSKGLALDTSGNVWIGSNTNANLYKYVPSTASYTTWPTLNVPYFVAADGAGNVFYTAVVGTEVAEFTAGATTANPTASTQVATVSSAPFFLAIDTTGALYTANSAAGATTSVLYASYPSTGTGNTGGFITNSTLTNICNPYGVAIGFANKVNVSDGNYTACPNGSANSLAALTQSAGVFTAGSTSATYSGGMAGPRENAVDGAGNVWSPNSTAASTNYATSATTTAFAVTEFSSVGAALSPTGNTGTASDSGGFQKDTTIFPAALRGIAIDPTGNVWVGLNSASATATSISEIVGAAVPVVTPIATALAAGVTTTNAVSKP